MPLFEDAAFRALQSGLDAMWLKQQVAGHNIANVETPGFKAKKAVFKGQASHSGGAGLMEGVYRVFGHDVPDVGKAFHT